jgi:hypothetical protein
MDPKVTYLIDDIAKTTQFIENGLILCEDRDLPYEDGRNFLNELETHELGISKKGFTYWKQKFEQIPLCESIDDIKKLYEEFMFTDPEEIRKDLNQSDFNAVQLSMRLFLNASANKLWSVRNTTTIDHAVKELSHGTLEDKLHFVKQIMEQICSDHQTSLTVYFQDLDFNLN